ncbi:MAG: DNA repair protein RecO [Microthrixaceae bacterium]|nr:DNA repair protein RecO [Microthrixaceae bacterium]
MALYRDSGVVLRTYKLGEADRIVVFLTRGRGKVRAVAKGVRKTKSRFGGRLEPTSHVNLQFYEGRGELDIVTQAETVEPFRAVRGSLAKMERAVAMLEVVDQVAQEGEENPGLYDMLVGGLRTVEHRDSPLVVPAFFLKLLGAEGVGLFVDGCIQCGREDSLGSIDLDDGGLRCVEHPGPTAMSANAVVLLQQVLGGHLAWALDQPVTAEVWEVDHLAHVAMERHVDRRLRALRLIERA